MSLSSSSVSLSCIVVALALLNECTFCSPLSPLSTAAALVSIEIDLPMYETRQDLKEKLKLAVPMASTEFMLFTAMCFYAK